MQILPSDTPAHSAQYRLWTLLVVLMITFIGATAHAQDDGGVQVLGDKGKGSKPIVYERSDPQGEIEDGADSRAVEPSTGNPNEPWDVEKNFSPDNLSLYSSPRNIKYTVDFREAPLEDVVKFISALTKRNFIVAATLGGSKTITIISPTPVSSVEAYRAFLSALRLNGLTITRSGDFYKIIDIGTLPDEQLNFYPNGSPVPRDDSFLTRIIQFDHIGVDQIQPILESFKTKQGQLIPYTPTNSLIVTDTGNSIRRMLTLKRTLDKPSADDERLWVYQVRYAEAQEIASLLGQVFQPKQNNQNAARARQQQRNKNRNAKQPAGAAGAAGAANDDVVISQIVPDERTNKLIIVANERSYQRIKRLILKIDVDLPDSGRINVVHLENSDAQELSQVLNDLSQELQPTNPRQPRAGGKGQQGAAQGGAGGGNSALLQGKVSVTANETTNDLIIVASPRDFQAMRGVIKTLDRPRKQVFVEAVIMEVSLDRTRGFGMALHGGNIFETSDGDAPLIGRTDLGGLQSVSTIPLFLGSGSVPGLLAAFAGPSAIEIGGFEIPSIGVVLRALQTNSDVNVLSTPTILTLDNEEAEISVGERIPFISSSGGGGGLGNLGALAQQAGVDGVPANIGALAGGLGGGFGTQIQRIDVALTLRIKPQINEAGYVRLEVEEEIEEVKPGGAEIGGPTTRRRNLKTVVVVKDQETVVLGGLIRDAENRAVSKVPILGDIPVIGYLFRSTDTQIQKQNLLLLLTPYLIEDESDKQKIYERKIEEFKAFQEYFGARDLNYIKQINFSKKHGLLEQMRQTVESADFEERNRRQGEGLLRLPQRDEGIELPEGMDDGYGDGDASPNGIEKPTAPRKPAPKPN